MSAELVLDDVSVHYGDVRAVDGACGRARPGEITAVTGHSGAGKTSLLWAVGGLLEAGQGSGDISLGGRVLAALRRGSACGDRLDGDVSVGDRDLEGAGRAAGALRHGVVLDHEPQLTGEARGCRSG